MRFQDRSNAYRPQYSGSPFGRRFSGLVPWLFVMGVVTAVVLTVRHGTNWPVQYPAHDRARDGEIILQQTTSPDIRLSVDVVRTIDGDTFLARVHQSDGRDLLARVRLRGIDAPR